MILDQLDSKLEFEKNLDGRLSLTYVSVLGKKVIFGADPNACTNTIDRFKQ